MSRGAASGARAGAVVVGAPGAGRLPVRLDPRVERYDGGRVLFDPRRGRLVTLSAAGVAALGRLAAGAPLGPAEEGLGDRLVRAGLAHPCPGALAGDEALAAAVCVVVPVRDRPGLLDRCLSALETAGPAGLEVVVVDDASADPGATAAVCAAHGARLVALPANGGPAGARNAGLAATDRPFVAFVDSDCRPTPGWLEPLVRLLGDRSVVAAAPRIRPVTPGGGLLDRYLAARSPLDMGLEPSEVGPGARVAYVPTAALVVRRSALGAGFDEALRHGEDVDLVWRLAKAGGRVRYLPDAVVDHEEAPTWRAALGRRLRYGTSAGPLARRHEGALAPLRAGAWPAAAVAAAIARRPGLAIACVALTAGRLARTLVPRGVPLARAATVALAGAVDTFEVAGRAATTLAWPALALVSVLGGRRRWSALALVVCPPLLDWRRRRPDLDPARFVLASAVDDAAYGCGVWWGAIRARSAGPLVPTLTRSSRRRSPAWRP